MTTQSQQQKVIDFELEMAEYYQAMGNDRMAERSRSIAADWAELATRPDHGPFVGGPVLRDRPEPEPEAEAEP